MSEINDEIAYILTEARQVSEKTANEADRGFSSEQEPSIMSSEVVKSLKTAAQTMRTHSADVSAQAVMNFVQRWR